MKIVSTNLSQPKTIVWKRKTEQTGIFKLPVNHPIQLGEHDVVDDAVLDRKYHGGVYKACYLYSANHYPFWKEKYPNNDLPFGMFGENLTVEGLDETKILIGSIYQVGSATIQISEPRQPCYKLGIRFENQGVLKTFINTTYSGIYVRVLTTGLVQVGDEFQLIKSSHNQLSIAEVFQILYDKSRSEFLKEKLVNEPNLRSSLKNELLGKYQ